jgi:hypothetical protein
MVNRAGWFTVLCRMPNILFGFVCVESWREFCFRVLWNRARYSPSLFFSAFVLLCLFRVSCLLVSCPPHNGNTCLVSLSVRSSLSSTPIETVGTISQSATERRANDLVVIQCYKTKGVPFFSSDRADSAFAACRLHLTLLRSLPTVVIRSMERISLIVFYLYGT